MSNKKPPITTDYRSPAQQNLAQMEAKIEQDTSRNLEGSLQQCKEELRDAYMNFKDLQTRCVVDLKHSQDLSDEHEEKHQVYYFKPDTFLLDDPEKQRQYRESLLKKISSIPKPDQITYLGDDLHRSMCQTIADRSTPKATKATLCEFFKRRQYALQHMKYKLLCRWAHHNLTSEMLENVSIDAAFIYGKLEFNLEQSILRNERLEQEDYYDQAVPENRPSTKSEPEGSALYVEKFDLLPQSLIREDDIEVYIRGVTHRNKINKLANKLMTRMKWLPMLSKYEIFEKAITAHYKMKSNNLERQNKMHDRVKERAQQKTIMTAEIEKELNTLLNSYYCKKYESMFVSVNDRTLHSWKANHDEVPKLISDQHLLKLRIQDDAKQFGMAGDIELDNGYSFSYQIAVFFPNYFQRQVLKSQFSIYDLEQDPNQTQKRTLNNMTRIDTNIFRDVSTTKHTVPTDDAIAAEMKYTDIKIIRLKSAANWIDYVALTPSEPDWHIKQQALLNSDNPIDTLLRSAFNFLDVNDLASVNNINEDNAQLHIKNCFKLHEFDPSNLVTKKSVNTADGEKFVTIDQMPIKHSQNVAANIEAHLLTAVQEPAEEDYSRRKVGLNSTSILYQMSRHLVNSHYTLRFITSRDAKTRILYTLNYFRAIQKRLAIDLREFATRDRIEGSVSNPFMHSKEANQHIVNQANFSAKAFEKIQKATNNEVNKFKRNMTVFDEKEIENMKNMASLRQYKSNGLFSQKILGTCPSYPKYHFAHGEPIVHQSIDEEQERNDPTQGKSLAEKSLKLMGRIDFIELNEQQKEVYVRDDFGIYIIFDCVFQDMKCLEDELCKIGSLFLHKSEVLIDPTTTQSNARSLPARDRLQIVDDILTREADFQFEKVKLVQVYMECYEHVTDPVEQQKLMQIVTDIMARRPRLNLNANYFIDAYDAEIKCLQKQFEVVKTLVDMQISLEKTENQRLQDSLELSFHLSNQYAKNRWQYQDAESLIQAIERTRQYKAMTKKEKLIEQQSLFKDEKPSQWKETNLNKEDLKYDNKDYVVPDLKIPASETKGIDDGIGSDLEEDDFGKSNENNFTKLLGLSSITLESIYQTYREKDHSVLKQMAEFSHFITVHEGYPEFLTRLTHRSIIDQNRLFKPNPWSQQTGSLDFYETLDFIIKFYSITQSMQQELYDGLKMWDSTLLTQIDIQVAELSLLELQKVIRIMEGGEVEYKGRALIEDEQVMGNCDKLIFYAKEMISDLGHKPKQLVDPFLIAKLDLDTIKFFDFPKIPATLNKYTLRRENGIAGADYLIQSEKAAIAGVAKLKQDQGLDNVMAQHLQGRVSDTMNRRNILVPSLSKTYSNMMELHRIRSELILTASECSILSQVYLSQCEFVGLKNIKLGSGESIAFDQIDLIGRDVQLVNFVEHGPAHDQTIDLAIVEFDKSLLSNCNFRNPDAFKMNILTSGLEEIRAVLQYQILQKHLLIVATRLNSLIIDSYQKSLSELNLISDQKIVVPNPNISYAQIVPLNTELINTLGIKNEKIKFKQNMSSFCLPLVYQINSKKNQSRTMLAKEYANYQTIVVAEMPHHEYMIMRVMRSFKLKLLSKFVQNVLTEVYLDAQKIQVVQSCQRLRQFNRYFYFDPKILGMNDFEIKVFVHETSNFIENHPINYLPQGVGIEESEKSGIDPKKIHQEIKVLSKNEIINYKGIPSSVSLIQVESAQIDELRKFKQKRVEIRRQYVGIESWSEKEDLKEIDPTLTDPEKTLKLLIPTFNPINLDEQSTKRSSEENEQFWKSKLGQSAGGHLDYLEGMYFGDSQYAQLTNYYLSLERIVSIEWFINKLQFRSDEAIHVDHAIQCGLPFWNEDEFDQRVIPELKTIIQKSNKRSQEFFFDQIVSLRQKKNLAEVVYSFSQTLKSFILQYQKTKLEQRSEYLSQYTEFRYQQVVGSMHKLVQQYYQQKNMSAVTTIQSAIAAITKMNHVKVVHLKPNNYSVSANIIAPDQFNIENGNLIYGSVQFDETQNFKRSVQPVINEKALEPPQVSLFQSLYQHDQWRRNNQFQFPGQFQSTTKSLAFKALELALIQLSAEERQYSQSFIVQAKYQANDFMETVFNDTSIARLTAEEAYTLSQLVDAKKFMNETTQALLLRNALICWFENSTQPQTPQKYEQFESNFRQNFFWKQIEQKEILGKKTSISNGFGQIPSQAQIQEIKLKIDRLINDQTLATNDQVNRRDALVSSLKEEFACLKKKVTLDSYLNTKAEIHVFQNEIEKFLIKASIKTLDSECNSLAKCFTMQVPSVQYHVHPFQQFAATFYDQVDPNLHLDLSNKINAVQVLLTKMRNRSTEVETLTSGPGMVVTIKDFNDILVEFCRTSIKDQEKQFKSRNETAFLKEEHLLQLLFLKDQKIKTLEHRIQNIGANLESIIDARLFEKGNHLIYELDSSNRLLNIYKSAIYNLEANLVKRIQGEQAEKFKRKVNMVEFKSMKFDQYKQTITNMINADFAEDQERIKIVIKSKAEQAKIIDKEHLKLFKRLEMYPANGPNIVKQTQSQQDQSRGNDEVKENGEELLQGAVIPKGFEHYQFCSCYVPDPRFPRPTLELAELEILSEAEARRELAQMCILLRKQRILFRTKEMCTIQKYQTKINMLTKNLNSNSMLWDQLAEAEKREKVMKQELLYAQQSLSSAEKTIINLKESLKTLDQDRGRLLNFKQSKVERLKELETRIKKIDIATNVDTDKLVAALRQKETQLSQIQDISQQFNQRLDQSEKRRFNDVQKLQRSLQQEQNRKQSVIDKMEQMKLELQMLETNDSSINSIWKKKCMDLFVLCEQIKTENDELRKRCKELIYQGIALAQAVDTDVLMAKKDQLPELSALSQLSNNENRNVKSTANSKLQQKRMTENSQITKIQNISADSSRYTKNRSALATTTNDDTQSLGFRSSPITEMRKRSILTTTNQIDRNNDLLIDGSFSVQIPQQVSKPRHINDIKSILQGVSVGNGEKRRLSTISRQTPQPQQDHLSKTLVPLGRDSTFMKKQDQIKQTKEFQPANRITDAKPMHHLAFDLKGKSIGQPSSRSRPIGTDQVSQQVSQQSTQSFLVQKLQLMNVDCDSIVNQFANQDQAVSSQRLPNSGIVHNERSLESEDRMGEQTIDNFDNQPEIEQQ